MPDEVSAWLADRVADAAVESSPKEVSLCAAVKVTALAEVSVPAEVSWEAEVPAPPPEPDWAEVSVPAEVSV